jgi:hypothetical protein
MTVYLRSHFMAFLFGKGTGLAQTSIKAIDASVLQSIFLPVNVMLTYLLTHGAEPS